MIVTTIFIKIGFQTQISNTNFFRIFVKKKEFESLSLYIVVFSLSLTRDIIKLLLNKRVEVHTHTTIPENHEFNSQLELREREREIAKRVCPIYIYL